MQKQFLFILIFFFGIVFVGMTQSTRDVDTKPKPPAPKYQSYKKEKKKFFLFRLFKKDDKINEYDPTAEVEQFRADVYKRVEARNREAQKAANNPQYSNPLYFGHKKPPKKRKPGKKKFCKECGLVH